MQNIWRQQFPLINQSTDLVYFDSAATTQKPQIVLETLQHFYQAQNVNVHRGSYPLAVSTTTEFESARKTMAKFINAPDERCIVFTKGTTDAINLVATCLARQSSINGKNIVVTELEHHANFVPWQQLAKQHQCELRVTPLNDVGVLDLSGLQQIIDHNTLIVAMGHVSNALGNINPVKKVIAEAKNVGALSLVDGAQAVGHFRVDVTELDCDFYTFSAHKMFGPTGIGVLYGKFHLLESLPPYQLGGEMIEHVSLEDTSFELPPLKFEAGTPNIEGVLGMAKAAQWLSHELTDSFQQYEQHLYHYLLDKFSVIEGIKVWGDLHSSVPILSFSIKDVSAQDVALILGEQGIAVRVGHHCAMPLMQRLGISGTIRVSLAIYNTIQEIDQLILALQSAIQLLKKDVNSGVVSKSQLQNVGGKSAHSQDRVLFNAISQAKGWDAKYRQLMLAGKKHQGMADEDKTADTRVSGCESNVWLKTEVKGEQLTISADSESKIIRGLLALICEVLNQQSVEYINVFDLAGYLTEAGLERHLSPSRTSGLNSVFNAIKQRCN
ncbi:SufS family cysteine desulfurase [Neptunicella marina]|uniref:cysteine desulfurase n=1 Tax=Neptunicella marina TaxID=2125989 RepID=A0A8J6LZT3_9ALTE|nr:SufS family cysteine desulfurase [Neptunicella marina]MBC3764272.1 SufS family cysteine desulfurase [Neptunicella marina]